MKDTIRVLKAREVLTYHKEGSLKKLFKEAARALIAL